MHFKSDSGMNGQPDESMNGLLNGTISPDGILNALLEQDGHPMEGRKEGRKRKTPTNRPRNRLAFRRPKRPPLRVCVVCRSSARWLIWLGRLNKRKLYAVHDHVLIRCTLCGMIYQLDTWILIDAHVYLKSGLAADFGCSCQLVTSVPDCSPQGGRLIFPLSVSLPCTGSRWFDGLCRSIGVG